MDKHTYSGKINEWIDQHIDQFFKTDCATNNSLRDVIKYIMQGGKRVRPSISLDIYNTLCEKRGCEKFYTFGFLPVEYIHTSSLVIDDLPCMDNAISRRGNTCVHKKYGEAIAQLSSAILLSLSTDCYSGDIDKAIDAGHLTKEQASEISIYFIRKFSNVLGVTSQGQLLDLESTNGDVGILLREVSSKISVEDIITKKTGTFFEMSFELGWILGTGSLKDLDKIKRLAHSFSMAFQIADDLEDMEEDLRTAKKNVNQNYALRYGKDKATESGLDYLTEFTQSLQELELSSPYFTTLVDYLRSKINMAV